MGEGGTITTDELDAAPRPGAHRSASRFPTRDPGAGMSSFLERGPDMADRTRG